MISRLFEKRCLFCTSWLTEYLHLPLPSKIDSTLNIEFSMKCQLFTQDHICNSIKSITPQGQHNNSPTKKIPPKTMVIRRGPVMLFVMTCRLRLGSMMQLHFFEPRYRYMCRHLTVGGRFGFMNGGRCSRGCTGVLCEVMEARLRRPCDKCTCCTWFFLHS